MFDHQCLGERGGCLFYENCWPNITQGLSQEWIFVMGGSDARPWSSPVGQCEEGLGADIGNFWRDPETLGEKSTQGPTQGESPGHALTLRGQFISVAGGSSMGMDIVSMSQSNTIWWNKIMSQERLAGSFWGCCVTNYRAGTLESARPEAQISVLPLESYVSMRVLNSANIHRMVVKIKWEIAHKPFGTL